MSAGGFRENSGRKKMPESSKKHLKTFCLDKDLIDWLNEIHGRRSHDLVRRLLRKQYNKETAVDGGT